jgi:hypothetical protein
MGAKAQEFKYFKRDWLAPAVDQINEVSDLRITFETRNEPGSRKIGRMRFRVQRKELAERVLHTHEHAQLLYQALKQEIGLSGTQFNQIASERETFTDERLEQALERTRFSLKLGKVSKSPAGFFMKALKEGWIVSDAERLMVQIQDDLALTDRNKADEKERTETRRAFQLAAQDVHAQSKIVNEVRQGWDAYEIAAQRQRDDWRRAYRSSPGGKLTLRRLGIDPSSELPQELINQYPDLKNGLAGYIFGKIRLSKTKAEG